MNAKIETIRAKAAAKLANVSTARLIEMYRATSSDNRPEIPEVRGFLLDEFERRDPEAFERWLNSDEHAVAGGCPDHDERLAEFFPG